MWKKLLLFIATYSMFAVTNSCDKVVEPEGINYHNKILFASSRSGKEQLYMMNPDGTDIRQITSGEYGHSGGRWSPDAKQIVAGTVQDWTTACYSKIVVLNVDGTNRRLLTCGSRMAWSPDGKKIIFSFMPRGELGDFTTYIYIINTDGTNLTQLTNNFGVQDDTPSWSPDGSLIAFSSDRDYPTGPLRSEIYLMNTDGNNQRRLTYTDSLINWGPAWSPDGNTISFMSNGELALIDKGGNNFRRISTNVKSNGFVLGYPSWSSDGKQIITTSYSKDGLVRQYLYIITLKNGEMEKILTDSTITSADWSK